MALRLSLGYVPRCHGRGPKGLEMRRTIGGVVRRALAKQSKPARAVASRYPVCHTAYPVFSQALERALHRFPKPGVASSNLAEGATAEDLAVKGEALQ